MTTIRNLTSRRFLLRALALLPAALFLGRTRVGAAPAPAAPMDAITCLKTRRSVRAYTDAPITDGQLREILACGMQAPSAHNEQPWQFVVVRDRALLDQAGQVTGSGALKSAALAILVCGDASLAKSGDYWIQDCANCAMNMLLAAHAQGLGAVWLGGYPQPDRTAGYKKVFALPDTITPLALLAMGHPATTPEPQDRFRPERIHTDRW